MKLSKITIFSSKLGIDKVIALTILTRVIQAGGSVLSIVFIGKYLSPNEQGYYYTFASIIAIQVFFELGLSGIITQYSAHEMAHLRFDLDLNITGKTKFRSRLSSILHFCIKWFAIISFFVFIILFIAGFYFFSNFTNNYETTNWLYPWLILCFSTALNLFIDPILAFFEGIGFIEEITSIRLVQKTSNILLLIGFFIFGFGLYSVGLASLISIAINYAQIFLSKKILLLKKLWVHKDVWVVDYYKEIFPFQWRIALSWISGYFMYQLFTPVLFATDGPIVAGQMGMTLQALNGISLISMSWINTKIPILSGYIAKKEFIQLDALFNQTLKKLILINIFLVIVFNIGLYILRNQDTSLANRFLSFTPTIILSCVCILNQLIFSWSTYIRCHKIEPFLVQTITLAVLISLSTVFLGKLFGLEGIVIGYGLILILNFGWTYNIYKIKKNELHF